MLAFTFPGQGSQRPAMGAPWVDHPSFALVEEASQVTGRDIAHLLLDADQATLKRTDNAQLATFVLSLVVLDAAERIGIEPSACAGHSLGEYSALVASGALGFDEGLKLVAERGAAMAEAAEQFPGTMVAVLGLADQDVDAACTQVDGEVWPANFNAPGQVIVSGSHAALEEFTKLAKQLGAKRVMPIPVGGAFHTPLMSGARDRLRNALGATRFRAPEPAVIANVDARAHSEPREWPELLSAQLCSPVRWRQSLETLFGAGMTTFAELGPGAVLTGLLKRQGADNHPVGVSVSTPEELDHLVELLTGDVPDPSTDSQHPYTTQRLVVSPDAGPFEPEPTLSGHIPGQPGSTERVNIEVGDRVGLVGKSEVRSCFSGNLDSVLVLPGETVSRSQPIARLRTLDGAEMAHAAERCATTDMPKQRERTP